ncbi:Arp8p NDAI_0C01370 [Naumovozyma dairenensis CBS 421]|uniref:Uncharacterized protein n=1 Tax=Naumovozyma dairenensis (strain ATCC 10597 / BCRC 20456 / CBS 421 / NBRC 0211 / NRRL Y-12639) TaxID=1071378 RepID=G0W7N7_NAUDC|nr:hypothetical protein NDAI_0C01370 [Naumovozyma dairenensis CBS 421]CCD23798.1 hypothetical protein NDAI_0C01370 [Naumovozyma dairenensis CBS 421]
MSQETPESSVIYEEPIDIPIEDDDEDDDVDEEDVKAESLTSTDKQQNHIPAEDNVDYDNDNDNDNDTNTKKMDPPTISRSVTATPIDQSLSTKHPRDSEREDNDDNDNQENENENEDELPSSSGANTPKASTPPLTPTPTTASTNKKLKSKEEAYKKYPKMDPKKVPPGKKVPLHLLEKRRLGRIKAAEEFAKKLKEAGIEKVESVTVPPTGLFQPLNLINQKNYSSIYLKNDDQIFCLRDDKSLKNTSPNQTSTATPDNIVESVATGINNKSTGDQLNLNDPTKTIIIHTGSHSLKIGKALDENPIIVPNCVAIPKQEYEGMTRNINTKDSIPTPPENNIFDSIAQSDEFNDLKLEIETNFKERMKYYKRRIQPNSCEQVKSFNKISKPEILPISNDPQRIQWINESTNKRYYGSNAERCTDLHFKTRKPFSNNGSFNIASTDYISLQDLLSDVTNLIEHSLTSSPFDLKPSQFKEHKVVLIIPDSFGKSHVELFITLLLTHLKFQAVAIIQESLATCYGAGNSVPTCVVNLGASQTTVACVDEGTVLENSMVSLNYGGNDITNIFATFLLQNDFPYHNWNLNSIEGWKLAEELKEKYITFQDMDVTVQLFNFIKRLPGMDTIEKYDFKVFDDVMLAPLTLFFPKILKLMKEQQPQNRNKFLQSQLPDSRDIYTTKINDWRSITQEECLESKLFSYIDNELELLKRTLEVPILLENFQNNSPDNKNDKLNYTPLDVAIIQSIMNASTNIDMSKMSSFYSNILVVGGGSKIPALDFILTDRINIWRPRLLSLTSFPNFYKELSKDIKDLQNHYLKLISTATAATTQTTATATTNNNTTNSTSNSTPAITQVPSGTNISNNLNSTKIDNTPGAETNEVEEAVNKLKREMDDKINELLKEKLEEYLETVEKAQNGNDHYLPVSVVPAPRDIDPALILWKGASVLAQLKIIEELYMTNADWDVHGSRILQYKSIFPY